MSQENNQTEAFKADIAVLRKQFQLSMNEMQNNIQYTNSEKFKKLHASMTLQNSEKVEYVWMSRELGKKANISVAISDDVILDKGLKAGDVIKELASCIRGGGGGQPMFASAGGSYPEGIKEALSKAESFLK